MANALFLYPSRTGFLLPLASHVNSGSNIGRVSFLSSGSLFCKSSEKYVVCTPSFNAGWHRQPQKLVIIIQMKISENFSNQKDRLRAYTQHIAHMHTHFHAHVCACVPFHGFAYWFDMNITREIKVFKNYIMHTHSIIICQ